jgi:CubicO group peptidase (beta-lactamase class C family)
LSDPDAAFAKRSHLVTDFPVTRRIFIGSAAAALAMPALGQTPPLADLLERAAALRPLQTVIVARDGRVIAERAYRGAGLSAATNIKSASKSVMSALVGAAIGRGVLSGVDQPVAPLLRADVPAGAEPRVERITIGHLLSMQAGLRPTSGRVYGQWVAGSNWVRGALAQPFEDEPGGRMLYSTGSTHLLSAALTRATGRSTLDNARSWLAEVDGFAISAWQRDPQGIYLGGNEMAMSPRSLLSFGEMCRQGGRNAAGTQVLPQGWIEASWTPRATSPWSGDGYGYGWFLRRMAGEEVRYGWGYGGQMLYVAPRLGLTVVMTSDDTPRPSTITDRDNLHALCAEIITRLRQA